MIETAQGVPVRVAIDKVWGYVKDMRRWATLLPGLQHCNILNSDDSCWVLKVGVGALVRTVKVDVHVDRWDGPERVFFSYRLQGDPVEGNGSYHAVPTGPNSVDMTIALQVRGSGPMAPMWEAMGGPLLPKIALAFAEELARAIETEFREATEEGQAAPAACVEAGRFALLAWLWRALFRRKNRADA